MENPKNKKEFLNSLDIFDEELEQYIPRLLDGILELGSMPEYIVQLIEHNIKTGFTTVTDLGCGKGAVLVSLAQRFNFTGRGIDIVSSSYVTQSTSLKRLGLMTGFCLRQRI